MSQRQELYVVADMFTPPDSEEAVPVYQKVGVLLTNDEGKQRVKLNCVPLSQWDYSAQKQVPWSGWLHVSPTDVSQVVVYDSRPQPLGDTEEDPF